MKRSLFVLALLSSAMLAQIAYAQQSTVSVDCTSKTNAMGLPLVPEEDPTAAGTLKLEKRRDGNLYVNGTKVVLYLSERQLRVFPGRRGAKLEGSELRNELAAKHKQPLNACALNAIFKNPQLFPEDWKSIEGIKNKRIFFFGTTFDDSRSNQCIEYFYWFADRPFTYSRKIDEDFTGEDFVAVLETDSKK